MSLFFRDKWKLKKIFTYLVHLYSRLGLKIIGINVLSENQPSSFGGAESHLYVSNHLSYLDVLIMAAQRPFCFVTSVEIKQTPFLGKLCEMAGCLFVERRSRDHLSEEISEITEALKNGLSVIIFPEATSTNGEQVLRFRQPLYTASMDSGVSVQPLCLNYTKIGEEPFQQSNRDKVCWYGDMSFAPHLWELLSGFSVEVTLSHLQELKVGKDTNVKSLAEKSHSLVSSRFRPC